MLDFIVVHTSGTKRTSCNRTGMLQPTVGHTSVIHCGHCSQVMLWQRKIELEREMNDVLDPTVGGDVVGAMKREIHRMQLRAGELGRLQEGLLLDLERSIAKRDTISLKVCVLYV